MNDFLKLEYNMERHFCRFSPINNILPSKTISLENYFPQKNVFEQKENVILWLITN